CLFLSYYLSYVSVYATSRILFSSLYCVHRYLHSFPTRRSSDLRILLDICGENSTHPRHRPGEPTCAARSPSPCCSASCSPAARVDRKSTRLNSSHQIISYAVFCLKKKKKKDSTHSKCRTMYYNH